MNEEEKDGKLIITVVLYRPLQGNLLKSTPSPTLVKQCGLKTKEKQRRVGHWRQEQRNRETIPGHWTSHGEGAELSDNSSSLVTALVQKSAMRLDAK